MAPINLVKSVILAPVDAKILEMLFVDGQRGWPSLDQRLERLNVVGSSPLHFANPEQDMPCSVAKRSIARHTSSCVIILSLLFFNSLEQNICCLVYVDFIPHRHALQAVAFPRNRGTRKKKITTQKIFLTKVLTNHFLYTIFRFVRGDKSR